MAAVSRYTPPGRLVRPRCGRCGAPEVDRGREVILFRCGGMLDRRGRPVYPYAACGANILV